LLRAIVEVALDLATLLVLGLAKTADAGAILPLDLPPWLGELRTVLAGLAAGETPARVPRWPGPS